MTTHRILLALLSLLTLATPASAEGDVLLWSHGYYAALPPDNGTKERWDLVQTFDVAGCDVAAAWFREHDSGPLAATRRVRVEYVCMPDTVDPRGPKGK